MKYLQATFKNYIGFYNGMGLYEVNIDFRKCQHNIVLITGKNGSGKSTLMNHLNPFPDSSNSFIPGKTAEKHLVLFDQGDTYTIQIVSPADLKGRKTTKAYIQKNGTELNENGNISSYKEIVFNEFELDANYVSLSRLSNSDRGLGDKTPAERKRFASNIVDNLETYNTIYKTLNKKSLIYKSHTNTIHTKIQNIGNADNLRFRLKQMQSREGELNREIMTANNTIVSIEAKYSIDEDEAVKIKSITDKESELYGKLSLLEAQVNSQYHKTKISPENIKGQFESDTTLLESYKIKLKEVSDRWRSESDRLREIDDNISSLRAELDCNISEDDIAERYNKSQNIIQELISELREIKIPENTDIMELEKVIAFCERFAVCIDKFNDGLTSRDLEYIIKEFDLISTHNLLLEQEQYISQIETNKSTLAETQGKLKLLATLEDRPKNCKIDTCPFIANAVTIQNELQGDIVESLASIQEINLSLSDKVTEIQTKLDYHNSMSYKKMELDGIRRDISEIRDILYKYYPHFVDNLDIMILNMNSFGFIRDHQKITLGSNLLKMLAAETQQNMMLEVEYRSYREKVQLLNSSRNMLSKLEITQANLVKSIAELKSDMDNYSSTINTLQTKVNNETEYMTIYLRYLDLKSEYGKIKEQLDEYQRKSSKAMEAMSTITGLRTKIANLSAQLDPLMREINTISGQLTLLDSYYEEYAKYKQSYDMIETLKKYCSPTSGGIQTLFMQLYMSKTKDIANSVLSMLFNGAYRLEDFIINENEFRIPFIGEGLPVDDISSGSGAQIAMMGMIINLVLLHQASTKFNIAQLDEVTATLDSYNNSQFTSILFYCMQILNIEQLFLISHSTETDNSYADVIKLKGYENYESNIQSGNVIWDFNEIIKQ